MFLPAATAHARARRNMTATPTESRRLAAYVAISGVCGLTWAAALRGWMVQLVGAAESRFSWLTLVLVLLPGLLIGLLLGRAAYLRGAGVAMSRWLVFSPALFAVALLDPQIFAALLRNGEGSGALMVVATALTAGFALSRPGRSPTRLAAALVAVLGLLLLGSIGTMAAPWNTPRGAWVSLLGLSLMLLLCLAAVLPYPPVRAPRGARSFVALGALCGFTWSAALRAFMVQVAGAESAVHWVNTFGYILLPGTVAGALLGLAEYYRRNGGRRHWRWLTLSPFLFAAILIQGLIEDPSTMFTGGVGAGTIAIPILAIIGGHALSGHGPLWSRSLAGLLSTAALLTWPITATGVGGPTFAITTPHGLWATILYDGLLVLLALAVSIPQRKPAPDQPAQEREKVADRAMAQPSGASSSPW